MKSKTIIFFCPNIINDGLQKTLKIYINYFAKYYKISLITNTHNLNLLKGINKKIKIINPKFKFFQKINIFNNLLCLYLVLRHIDKKTMIFSMNNHFFLLLLKFLRLKIKIVLRTPNPIFNIKNPEETKYLSKGIFTERAILNLYKYANLVITFSKNNQNYLREKFKVKNVKHIFNYFPKFNGKKKVKSIYNIFFIGRLVYSKDPIFFLKNSIELLDEINIKIHVVGDGKLNKVLKKMSQQFKKKIYFYNFVNHPFKKYNKKIDLICITSRFDGTPNVLGETMSYKIPCVAPKGVGLSNVLLENGRNGYLYKPGDDLSFKRTIKDALKNYKNSIKKAKLGYNSLDRFNKDNTLGKLRRALSKI